MAGVIAGGMTKTQHAGRRRVDSHPGGHPQHRLVHAGRAEREPEGHDPRGLGQQVVRPPEGERGGAGADERRRRRADAEHRLVGGAAGGRKGGQARLRLGLGHVQVRPARPPRVGGDQLGAVLQEVGQGRPRRDLEDRTDLVGRQGGRHRSGLRLASCSGRRSRRSSTPSRPASRAGRTRSGRGRSSTRTARRCWRRARRRTTSSCTASTST